MSRDHLVKDVDRNTKYFQIVPSIKRRKGRWDIFYKDLYTQHESPSIKFEEGLVSKILTDEAASLEVLLTEEEIRRSICVLWSIQSPRIG